MNNQNFYPMNKNRGYLHLVYLVVDIILIAFSFYLSYYLRYESDFISNRFPYFLDYSLLFSLWGLSLVFILNNHNLYSTDRSLSILKEIWLLVKCIILSSLLTGLIIFLLKTAIFSRLVFTWAVIFLSINLSIWRTFKRIFVKHLISQGYYNLNVLIVGAGKTGCLLAEEIENSPYLGLKIVGFIDDAKVGNILKYNILGKSDNLRQLLQQYFVDEIYITIPSEREMVSMILALGREMNKSVRIVTDSFTFSYSKVKLNYIGFIPIISYIDSRSHGTEIFFKRLFDVIVAGIGLTLLVPFFIVIAFLIKSESPGSIFYISKRCGKKGKVFDFYKFRSMFNDADSHKETLRDRSEVKGPIFKIKQDPRITRIGKFLRRYSLDELPQLINVIKGDMSLVGPRPHTPDEVAKYDTWQLRRLEIKPGITCLWQVRGRSELSFYKWVKWDLWYIDNWYLGLDLLILLWTIPATLRGKGAY